MFTNYVWRICLQKSVYKSHGIADVQNLCDKVISFLRVNFFILYQLHSSWMDLNIQGNLTAKEVDSFCKTVDEKIGKKLGTIKRG